MTIQIVSMKYTGQQLVADVGEVYTSEEAKEQGERPMCLTFTNPYLLEIEDETASGFNLRMSKWNPYTDEISYNVGFDLVGMIHDPKRAILDAYKARVTNDTPKPAQFDPGLQPNVTQEFTPVGVAPEGTEFSEETVVNLTPTEEVESEEVAQTVE
jgi:hypothetical protein